MKKNKESENILSELERFSSQKPEGELSTGFSIPLTKVDTDALTPVEAASNVPQSMSSTSSFIKDRYQLRKNISVKENGIIQSAYDCYLGREIALKKNYLSPQESASETQQALRSQLKREASITAILEHPNIVPIYDFQENSKGESYFTMRKMEGQSLNDFLKKCVDPDENKVLTLYLKICDAICYAHSRSVVHLDLKPENIWIGDFGEVYVMNWGSAQLQTNRSHLQETSDLYALGKILQECFSVMQQIPSEIQAILDKATHPNWQERYPSVDAFIGEIERYQNHMQVLVKAYGPLEAFIKWTQRNPQKTKAGVLFLGAFLFFSATLAWKEQSDRKTALQKYYEEAISYRQQAQQQVPESNKEKLGQKLAFLYQSLNAFHRAIELDPQKETLYQEIYETGRELIRICCVTTDYQLAQFILREIQKLKKLPEDYKIKLFNQLIENKNATAKHSLQRLNQIETQFRGAQQTKDERKNALYEISRMHGDLVQQRLKTLLQEGTQSILNKSLSVYEVQFYLLIVEAIGRSQIHPFAVPLLESLKCLYAEIKKHSIEEEIAPHKTEYMVALAYALKDLNAIELAEDLRALFILMQIYQRTTVSQRLVSVLEKLAQGSILYYSKILEQNPENETAYYFRGMAYVDQNKIEKAFQDFDRAIQLNPTYVDAYFNRGNVKIKKGEISAAIEDFSYALQLKPDAWEIYTNRGGARELQKDFTGALADYTEALRLNPSSTNSYNNRGLIKQALGDFAGALEDFNYALHLNPQLADAYNNRGRLQRNQGFLDAAIQDFTEAIRLNAYQPEAYLNRGMTKRLKKDFEGALQDLTELIRLHPEYESAYQGRGMVKQEQGDLDGALQDFTEAIRLVPTSDSYNLRGLIRLYKEAFQDAIQDFSKAIELKPEEFLAHYNRGVCKSQLKEFQDAIEDYTRAIRRNPDFLDSYFNRALDRESLQDLNGALADYAEVLRLNPQMPEAYYQRGMVKRKIGDLKSAIEDLSEAIRLDPQLADAYYQRGMTYGRKFQESAKKDFQQFLDLTQNTENPEIQEQRNALLKSFPDLK